MVHSPRFDFPPKDDEVSDDTRAIDSAAKYVKVKDYFRTIEFSAKGRPKFQNNANLWDHFWKTLFLADHSRTMDSFAKDAEFEEDLQDAKHTKPSPARICKDRFLWLWSNKNTVTIQYWNFLFVTVKVQMLWLCTMMACHTTRVQGLSGKLRLQRTCREIGPDSSP